MTLPFDPKRIRAYEIEFGAGGQRLGCKFLLDDGSIVFVHESQITPEIESLIARSKTCPSSWAISMRVRLRARPDFSSQARLTIQHDDVPGG